MAIVWGSVSVRAQLGIDVTMSPSTVTSATSSVTLTWKVYFRTDRGVTPGYNGTYTLARTGTGPTGTSSESLYTSPNVAYLLWEGTQVVSTSYSGTVSRSMTAVIPQTGTLFDGARPSTTRSISVPKRPPQAPSAPVSATVTRNSDSRQDVSWVRPASASTLGTQWDNAIVQRSVDGGSYATVATLAGTATSWSDTATSANHQYRYRVAGRNNSTQYSSYTYTTYISTTPAAPTNVRATKIGSDIEVEWDSNVPPLGHVEWEVYDNGVLDQTVAWNVTTVTITAPNPAVTHTYTVRAKTLAPVLYSAYGTSNVVQLQAPPNAPINLTPNGSAVNAGSGLYLTWDHNPVDTTTQTVNEVQHRLVGSGTWTTVTGGVYEFRYYNPASTFYPSGSNVEWRVRTKGAHVDWSPYSATASFSIVTPPVASLIYPDTSGTHDEPSIEVEWSYYQADSHVQSGWEVQIYQGATLIASGSGTGSSTRTWTSNNVLQGEQTYDVRVRVRESSGFWSAWDTQTILVQFDPPLSPIASVEWIASGYYEVTGQAQSDGVAPETVTLNLERSVNGGPWQTLASDLGLEFTYFDWTAPMVGYIQYRITALTALPSSATTTVVSDQEPGGCGEILLSGGPGMARVIRLPFYEKRNITAGRQRVLNQFDGRENPVSTSGVFKPLSITVDAVLLTEDCPGGVDTNAFDVVELAELVGTHYYRDRDGWTFPCHLSDVQVSPDYRGVVSFTVTRVDLTDAEAELAIAKYNGPALVETRPGEYIVVGGSFEEIGIGEWGLADA